MKFKSKHAFLIFLFLCVPAAQAQKATLTPDEVKAAIDKGTAQKNTFRKEAGLGLLFWGNQVYRIQVFTPTTWVQWQAIHAAFAHTAYTASDDDLRPVLRIIVDSIKQGNDCVPVSKVLLRNKTKTEFVQPSVQNATTTVYQNGFGATMGCDSVYVEFNLSDVARIRSPDPEFTILVLKDQSGSEMSLDVKKKHFEQIP